MAVVAAAGAGAAATDSAAAGAPALTAARAQALLISVVRLGLAALGFALVRLRGVEAGVAAGVFALGAGLLLFAVLASARRRRAWRRIAEAQPAPQAASIESWWRSLVAATYPSTIGLTILDGIALAVNPRLAALLAGILAGLGLAALGFAAQLAAWERERHARLLVERGRGGRAFLGPG
ncbi:MAG TPA: hypothetical protein VGJ40_03345 [Gaiellaceae bacterium]